MLNFARWIKVKEELGLELLVVSHRAELIIHAAADAVLRENSRVRG
jgi:hypothetical protein